jgi:sulfur carrier protein ThiS
MALGRNPLLDKSNQSQSRVGSGFTNLQRVLDANKQNRLGQTISTGVGALAEQNKQAVGQAKNQFQAQTEQNRLDTDANTQFRNQALETARSGVTNDQDVERFNTLQLGQYAGPQNLNNVDALKGQAQQVQQLGTFGTDANKTKGLLQKFVGSPRYNLGQKTLDSTVLGQDPNVARNIRQQTVGVERGVNRASSAAQAQAIELGNRARGFGQETQAALANEATNYDAAMQQKALAGTAARNALIEKAKLQIKDINNIDGGSVDRDVAEALGLTEGQELVYNDANPIYGVNNNVGFKSDRAMSDYYSYNALDANKQSIQSADDFAKIQALKRLGGSNANAAALGTFDQYGDANRVGEYAKAPIADFAKDAYTDDLKRLNDYKSGQVFTDQVEGFRESTRDAEQHLFNTGRQQDPQTYDQIINRKASTLNRDVLLNQVAQENLLKSPEYAQLPRSHGQVVDSPALQALTAKTKQDLLNNPTVQTALNSGTVKDLLASVGKSTERYGLQNNGEILNSAGQKNVETNLSSMTNRYDVIKQLQDWAKARTVKIRQ